MNLTCDGAHFLTMAYHEAFWLATTTVGPVVAIGHAVTVVQYERGRFEAVLRTLERARGTVEAATKALETVHESPASEAREKLNEMKTRTQDLSADVNIVIESRRLRAAQTVVATSGFVFPLVATLTALLCLAWKRDHFVPVTVVVLAISMVSFLVNVGVDLVLLHRANGPVGTRAAREFDAAVTKYDTTSTATIKSLEDQLSLDSDGSVGPSGR